MEAAAIGSMVLGATSSIMQGSANAKASSHSAQQAVYAAQSARINANATDAYYRDDLRKTLSNIDAIRASAGMGDSPTSQAVKDENTRVSDDQRITKVTGIRAQAAQNDADAKYYTSAAKSYMGLGFLNAATGLAGGIAKGSF